MLLARRGLSRLLSSGAGGGGSIDVLAEGRYLRVRAPEVGERVFPAVWVRDHCRGEGSFQRETQQRLVDSGGISAGLRIRAVEEAAAVDDGERCVRVLWQEDGEEDVPPPAMLPLRWLLDRVAQAHDGAAGESQRQEVSRVLWNGTTVKMNPPVVRADKLLHEPETEVPHMLAGILSHGFVCVDGVEPTMKATQWLAELIGPVRNTIFGGMWEFQADLAAADTAYTNLALGAHSDGTYFSHAPGLQMLHCVHYKAEGGDNLLVDGFHCLDQLRDRHPMAFDFLVEHSVPAHYVDSQRNILLRTCQPIIRLQPDGSFLQLRYNNNDRAPLDLDTPFKIHAFYESLRALSSIIQDPANEFWMPLRPGRVLIFDNWRLLHGRAAYRGDRRMTGCYIDRDDFVSRCRAAGLVHP